MIRVDLPSTRIELDIPAHESLRELQLKCNMDFLINWYPLNYSGVVVVLQIRIVLILYFVRFPKHFHFGSFKGYRFFLPILILILLRIIKANSCNQINFVPSVYVGSVNSNVFLLNTVTKKKVHCGKVAYKIIKFKVLNNNGENRNDRVFCEIKNFQKF